MKTIILHGYGASGDSSSSVYRLSKILGGEILRPTYFYDHADKTSEMLSQYVDELNSYPGPVLIAGISLGGFWASWMASKVPGSILILVNPSIQANVNLKKYVTEDSVLTEDMVGQFEKYVVDVPRNVPVLLLISTDDEVIPYEYAYEKYSGRAEIILMTGGHRALSLENYGDRVTAFVNNANFLDS